MKKLTLVGVKEIAQLTNVCTAAVVNWAKRYADFPTPLAILRCGPIYSYKHIARWLKRNRVAGWEARRRRARGARAVRAATRQR